MEESERPGQDVGKMESISLILHSVPAGKKAKEMTVVNKLHYFLGTNELLRYIDHAERSYSVTSSLLTLKGFLHHYKFAEHSEFIGNLK
jgi:hypothetical protein